MLSLTIQTGLRASELVGLNCDDIHLDAGPHVYCCGKGRKERCTPLSRKTVTLLRTWLREQGSKGVDPLFPNVRGGRLSVDGFQLIVAKHATTARKRCPSLQAKRVSPHVLRHTTAMDLLQAGIDRATIALWLGHESVETTQIYLDANLALKEQALAKTAPVHVSSGRFRPDDSLMAFLQSL
jgi:site-specific recombinase XerD